MLKCSDHSLKTRACCRCRIYLCCLVTTLLLAALAQLTKAIVAVSAAHKNGAAAVFVGLVVQNLPADFAARLRKPRYTGAGHLFETLFPDWTVWDSTPAPGPVSYPVRSDGACCLFRVGGLCCKPSPRGGLASIHRRVFLDSIVRRIQSPRSICRMICYTIGSSPPQVPCNATFPLFRTLKKEWKCRAKATRDSGRNRRSAHDLFPQKNLCFVV
mmetsp:Transcript_6637/g.14129  ORF Transcript_6637/g.14129 Transcript_6637/m.14129 type:complete len:214 (-) Transcript_6637:994-1635(-)